MESASSRNDQVRASAGLGEPGSAGSRKRVPPALGEGEGSDRRPEVKSREYSWNGIWERVWGGVGGRGTRGSGIYTSVKWDATASDSIDSGGVTGHT